MLISIVGTDFEKKNKRVKEILAGLEKNRPDAIFAHYDFLDLNENKLVESISTIGGLFEEKNIFLFSNIFYKNNELKKLFFENIEKIRDSENAFVLSEDKISPAEWKILEKNSWKAKKYDNMKIDFNIFEISNAVQSKNKKSLWLSYHKALKSGMVAEQIYGNIFYAIKTLALAEKFSEPESGLKAFPYKKAKNSLIKWEKNEASQKLFSLVEMYNQSRLKGLSLNESLEKYILEL